MAWVLLAPGGAVCTSMTTILAKIGIKDVNSNFATAYRTLVVIVITNQAFKAGLRIATWVMPFHLTISHTSKPSFL